MGDFHIRLQLQNVCNKKIWDLLVVYGVAQTEHKAAFLAELSKEFQASRRPIVIGGDFNILRKESEKNKAGGYNKWSFLFNAILEQNSMRDIQMGVRQFTWCNNPTLEKLDRVFINNEWEADYPLTSVHSLVRALSDHNPILLDTGNPDKRGDIFRFELSWFLREDLDSIVQEVWNDSYSGSTIERWQKRFGCLRRKLKGWNKNWEGEYKRRKYEILSKIDVIDSKIETCGMNWRDREERRELELNLKFTIREEKTKWFQRSKEKETLEGDCNTKYYHAKANGRKRKSRSFSLSQDEGLIEGQAELLRYITAFYKDLFGHSKLNNIKLDMGGATKITEEDAALLIKPFSLEEVKKVVFDLKQNKAPGPDGFPGDFYRKFWDLIKTDFLELLNDFHKGVLDIERLNFGIITLVPKSKDAAQIQKFRPICLLNVSFKIIT